MPGNIAEEPGFRRRMEAKQGDPVPGFDDAQAFAASRKAFSAIFASPLPSPFQLGDQLTAKAGEARRALDRGERVVLTANGKELAIFEPHPGAVLAACLRRAYDDAGRVTSSMLDAAQSFLPDVDRDALRLAIEGALKLETTR